MIAEPIESAEDGVPLEGNRLTELLATVSHELRTPATLLLGLAGTLTANRDRMTSSQVTDVIQRMERQANRLVRLLDDMLDTSKIRSGHKLQLTLGPVNLGEVVDRAVLASAPPADVSLKTCVPPGAIVWSDAAPLERAIVNLLRNAFKYGGRNVVIEGHPATGGFALTVSDDGPGVAPEIRRRLFEPFSASKGGTGLGLAIVKAVAEASGGEATYDQVVPSGSRFTMRLRDEPAGAPQPAVSAVTRDHPLLVLIVDDEPDVLFLLRMTLQHAGYEVEEAPHGGAALERMTQVHPDVIITDLMMPVVDGRELIRRIRDIPGSATTPIMLLSASPDETAGADRVIRKPFDPRHLVGVIEELAGGRV